MKHIVDFISEPTRNGCPGRMSSLKSSHFDVRVGGGGNLSMGVSWCKSVGVICSEGVKWCKSWAAMGGLLRNYPPDWNCHVRVGCNGLQWEDFSGITPPPATEIAMYEWAAMCCNGRTFQKLPPDCSCHVRVGCNGLQWEDFSEITPWLKLPCTSGLQWAAMGGVFRNYPPPWLKLPCKSGLQWAAMGGLFRNYPLPPWLKLPCKSGLQWAAMGGLFRNYPPDFNCHVRVGCSGLQWEEFSGMTLWLKLPRGLKTFKSEVLICPEGVTWAKVWAVGKLLELLVKGVKWCKSEGVICSEGVKWCKSWAAKGGKIV